MASSLNYKWRNRIYWRCISFSKSGTHDSDQKKSASCRYVLLTTLICHWNKLRLSPAH